MSLRWRLALSMGLLLLFMVALVSVSAYLTTASRLREEVDNSVRQRASALQVLFNNGPRELPASATLVQLLDERGVIARTTGEVRLPVNLREINLAKDGGRVYSHTVVVDGERYRLAAAPLDGGGLVQAAQELRATESTLESLRRRYAAISGLVALLAAILGWLLAGLLVRRVVRLTAAAEHVASTGDLEAPVEASGRDEAARLGQAFSSMLAALRESRARQRQLVQDAGHELRTPVTSIRTNVDVLRRFPNLDDADRVKVLDDLHSEVTQVSVMVDELVLLASGDGGDDESPGPLHLDEIVRSVAERSARRFAREVTVDVEPTEIIGSARALERAVNNLFTNAAKFSPEGAPIEVSLRAGRVTVRDHGPGIDAEDIGNVFERFYRATAARTQPGSGLGLAIVDQVARSHGGEPFAGNHPDGGAVVGFTVPLSPPPD